MALRRFTYAMLFIILVSISAMAQQISKEKIASEGKNRSYYIYVPKTVQPGSSPVPLVVLLHGSNHIGLSLAEKWDKLAEKESFVIVAPDSTDSAKWSIPGDGPQFLHELVESIKAKYPINRKKVYLFGHSGGAVFGLLMSLYESEYFAAAAVHAGALREDELSLVDEAKRKTPIQIQVGTVDELFPVNFVRATRDVLNTHGFPVQLIEIPHHDHWYYDLAPSINQAAWDFLKTQELPGEPSFEAYNFRQEGQSKEATEQYNRGLALQRAGDMAGAMAAYTRAIERDGKYADAYNNRGVLFMIKKDDAAALADFTRSIALAPSQAAYNNRAGILFSQGKFEAAISDLSASIQLKPSAEGYANRGTAYQQTNQETLALADYEQAIKLNANFGRAYVLRGLIFLRQRQTSAAEKDFEKGFQLDKNLHLEFDPMIKQLRPNP